MPRRYRQVRVAFLALVGAAPKKKRGSGAPKWEGLRDRLAAEGYGWRVKRAARFLRDNDLWSRVFADWPVRVLATLLAATLVVFAGWSWFMLAHT